MSNDCAVLPAISYSRPPNLDRFEPDKFKRTLMSISFFSVLTNEENRDWTADCKANIAPAEAPKAITRAFAAANDLSISATSPLIFPNGRSLPETEVVLIFIGTGVLDILDICAFNCAVFAVNVTGIVGFAMP